MENIFQNIDVYTFSNVEEKLKLPFSEALNIIGKSSNIYKVSKLEKLYSDLENNMITIQLEPVCTSKDTVGADIDRNSYGYGYIDFGKESIIYNNTLKKKIVIWREIVERFETETVIKALIFLLDMYLSLNEEAVFSNYINMSKALKSNYNVEYMVPTDMYGNVPIGGFRLSIMDKWCRFYAVAISDIVSTYLTKTPLFFNIRSKFINTVLSVNNKTLLELLENREQNNMDFFYSLIPETCAKKIGFFGIIFENYDMKNYANYIGRKVKLECAIYDYITQLYDLGIMDNHSKDNQEQYISDLLELSHTLYNSDVKVDFRDKAV